MFCKNVEISHNVARSLIFAGNRDDESGKEGGKRSDEDEEFSTSSDVAELQSIEHLQTGQCSHPALRKRCEICPFRIKLAI
jgi:hypothetical protein